MAIPEIRRKPLNLTKRTTRKLSSLHAYSRLYYKEKLKVIVDARWEQHIAENPVLKNRRGEVLRHRNAVIREVFNAETDEIKEEVEKRREEGFFSEEEIDPDDDDGIDSIERQRHAKALSLQRKVILIFHFPSSRS